MSQKSIHTSDYALNNFRVGNEIPLPQTYEVEERHTADDLAEELQAVLSRNRDLNPRPLVVPPTMLPI